MKKKNFRREIFSRELKKIIEFFIVNIILFYSKFSKNHFTIVFSNEKIDRLIAKNLIHTRFLDELITITIIVDNKLAIVHDKNKANFFDLHESFNTMTIEISSYREICVKFNLNFFNSFLSSNVSNVTNIFRLFKNYQSLFLT